MAEKDYYNDTSNTAAGINTPPDHEGASPTDMISGGVEEIVDKIHDDFVGGNKKPRANEKSGSTDNRR